jgi:hypothetical protein
MNRPNCVFAFVVRSAIALVLVEIIATTFISSLHATPISFKGGTYTQAFDSLPSSGNAIAPEEGPGPHDLDGEYFGFSGMQGWQIQRYTGTAELTFRMNHGTTTSQGIFSYGSMGSTDRALGTLATSSPLSAYRFGVILVNDTPFTIDHFDLQFKGEHWRRSATSSKKDTLQFQYAVGQNIDINTGTYQAVETLNFASQQTVGSGALNGNAISVELDETIQIAGSNLWEPGMRLVLRWTDIPALFGDGLAIDDLILTTVVHAPEPSTMALMTLAGLISFFRIAIQHSRRFRE